MERAAHILIWVFLWMAVGVTAAFAVLEKPGVLVGELVLVALALIVSSMLAEDFAVPA